jgi:hypothetical protein
MAVLVEAISVIVKTSAIHGKYPGGWQGFLRNCPNRTLVADGELARIGFMDPRPVREFVKQLKSNGLVFAGDSKDSDFCVADQLSGTTTACDWIDIGTVPVDGDAAHMITAARLKGSQTNALKLPDGWTFKGSLSEKPHFLKALDVLQRLKYLRTDGNVDVFWDPVEGKETFAPKAS